MYSVIAMRKTKLSGGVLPLRAITEPKKDAVIRYRRTENHKEEFLWSRVSLSISRDFSSVSSRVFLKEEIVSFNWDRFGTLWSEGCSDLSH